MVRQPPAARVRDAHLGDPAVELVALRLGPDHVERVVLQHADANAVPCRGAAVLAVAVVVDRGRGAREP